MVLVRWLSRRHGRADQAMSAACATAPWPSCKEVADLIRPSAEGIKNPSISGGVKRFTEVNGRRSGVVVHGELVGMRTLAQLLHFLVFDLDPVVDEVFGEHPTFQQVVVIFTQGFEGAVQ